MPGPARDGCSRLVVERRGVDPTTMALHTIVEVRCRRQAGLADEAYRVTLANPPTPPDLLGEARKMEVRGLIAAGVIDLDRVAASLRPSGRVHNTAGGTSDRCAGGSAVVHTPVGTVGLGHGMQAPGRKA